MPFVSKAAMLMLQQQMIMCMTIADLSHSLWLRSGSFCGLIVFAQFLPMSLRSQGRVIFFAFFLHITCCYYLSLYVLLLHVSHPGFCAPKAVFFCSFASFYGYCYSFLWVFLKVFLNMYLDLMILII